MLIELDGTENKERLGANTILAVSMSPSRAASSALYEPFYRYRKPREKYFLPIPVMNVINRVRHGHK